MGKIVKSICRLIPECRDFPNGGQAGYLGDLFLGMALVELADRVCLSQELIDRLLPSAENIVKK